MIIDMIIVHGVTPVGALLAKRVLADTNHFIINENGKNIK